MSSFVSKCIVFFKNIVILLTSYSQFKTSTRLIATFREKDASPASLFPFMKAIRLSHSITIKISVHK